MWQYSSFSSISLYLWSVCGVFKESFPFLRKEVVLTSTRSFAVREDPWQMVKRKSLTRDSFRPLLRQQSTPLTSLPRQEIVRNFPLNEYETRKQFSYLCGTLREQLNLITVIFPFWLGDMLSPSSLGRNLCIIKTWVGRF